MAEFCQQGWVPCPGIITLYGFTRDMPTVEILKIAKWDSLHFMYKVKLATLAYKIFYDCSPPSMGHILAKDTSRIRNSATL